MRFKNPAVQALAEQLFTKEELSFGGVLHPEVHGQAVIFPTHLQYLLAVRQKIDADLRYIKRLRAIVAFVDVVLAMGGDLDSYIDWKEDVEE